MIASEADRQGGHVTREPRCVRTLHVLERGHPCPQSVRSTLRSSFALRAHAGKDARAPLTCLLHAFRAIGRRAYVDFRLALRSLSVTGLNYTREFGNRL